MPVTNVADRAPAFNVPAEIGFGNDIFEVRRIAARAIEHARNGHGPYLVEFKTFRQRGHGEHDDMSYVPRDLREFWERRDPIALLVDYLRRGAGVEAHELDAIDRECAELVEAGLEWARAQPDPKADSVGWRLFK
jgi:TPP-dependent pyruvate/acetoin dehydrogenase alpha subunit